MCGDKRAYGKSLYFHFFCVNLKLLFKKDKHKQNNDLKKARFYKREILSHKILYWKQ